MGLGDGDSVGLGDGDSEGLGDGLGLFVGEGAGAGTGVAGPWSYPWAEGVGKSTTGMFVVTSAMKSCQMAAGIVPPNTGETPSTLCIGVVSFFGYPIHTQVASWRVYPQNHAST